MKVGETWREKGPFPGDVLLIKYIPKEESYIVIWTFTELKEDYGKEFKYKSEIIYNRCFKLEKTTLEA